MAVSLVSTGVQFPDSSIQTTAALAPSFVLISSTNATSATTINIDFSSSYDNYFFVGQNIANDTGNGFLACRVKVGGTVQSGATDYGRNSSGIPNNFANANYMAINSSAAQGTSGAYANKGLSFWGNMNCINNAFSKTFFGSLISNTTDIYHAELFANCFYGTSTLSGVQFYFLNGSNFTAQGSIKLYGYKNS